MVSNLELYRVFYTVAKCGSLTKASEELYISQPAVSQAIKQLESQLGTTLFTRTHKGMELSGQCGRVIFKEVEEALRLLEDAQSKLTELQTMAMGTIRIGATDSIFSHVVADRIIKYREQCPEVKIELITGTSPETITQLKEAKCDIGFVNLPIEDKEVNVTGVVAHLSDVFVASEKFSDLKGRAVDLKELTNYPLLLIQKNTIARIAMMNYLKSLGIQLTPDIEFENWDLMLRFAAAGIGIGCIPREYALPYLDSGELFEVDVTPALPVRGVGMALPKDLPVSFALKKFISLFD